MPDYKKKKAVKKPAKKVVKKATVKKATVKKVTPKKTPKKVVKKTTTKRTTKTVNGPNDSNTLKRLRKMHPNNRIVPIRNSSSYRMYARSGSGSVTITPGARMNRPLKK
jgi:hypothetical protein